MSNMQTPTVTERIAEVRKASAERAKQAKEFDSTIAELKKMQMATMMGASKPSVVLTDQTDLGDKIKELTIELVTAVQGLDGSEYSKKQIVAITELQGSLSDIAKSVQQSNKDNQTQNADLLKQISKLKLDPIIRMPSQTPLNLKPLQDTLLQAMQKDESGDDKYDLSCYQAQDLSESGDKQYVGFMNHKGNWYIIENDVKGNAMRYLFGETGYAKHFAQASTYEYHLLNEAVNG